jgi:Large eukaryotic DNA virus major capsid protein/Major capsid protein N-terminus
MGGALLQLVAYGAQDVYLTGDPKVTFFQAVFKRHTNFSMETIQQMVDGSALNGSTFTVTAGRHGDLLGYTYVQLKPKAGLYKSSNNVVADTNWVAERAFAACELQIGGQRIDKHFQTWWRLYAELFLTESKKRNYARMATFAGNYSDSGLVYLPLHFFFCYNPGLYLPLVALQYSEVKFVFDVSSVYLDYFEGSPIVWSNYIYLDTAERAKYASGTQEYLITQVQHSGGDPINTGTSETVPFLNRLAFNHPVQEIVWCYHTPLAPTNRNALWNFTSNCSNCNVTCNPIPMYNNATYTQPDMVGIPLLAMGTTANVYAGDGEHSTNFTVNYPQATLVGSAGTLNGAPAGLSLSASGTLTLASVQNGDILVGNIAGSITGYNPNWFYQIRNYNPATGGMNLTSSFNQSTLPNQLFIATDNAGITGASGSATVNVVRLQNSVPVTQLHFGNTIVTSTGQFSTIIAVPQKIDALQVGYGILFSNVSGSSQAGNPFLFSNLFYIQSIDYLRSNIIVANTWSPPWAISNVLPEGRYAGVGPNPFMWGNALVVSITSNVAIDNRPPTSSWTESGAPGKYQEVGPLHKFKLLFNGKDRFLEQYGKYFNTVQPFYHHTGNPYPGIYCYSFSLRPEEFQPMGTCNFSRIDVPQAMHWLKTTSTQTSAYSCKMFAVNYNILRIQSGMGGIMFSN